MDKNWQKNISLAQLTGFKIGGPVRFFVEVKNKPELIQALTKALEENLPFFILGGGTNLLISDNGFNGLVIKMSNERMELLDKETILVESGCKMSRVITLALDNNLKGLEWAAGIPGTLGGSVKGNAGCFGFEMKDIIEEATVIEIKDHDVSEIVYSAEDCDFDYRSSVFKKNKNIIWDAKIKLASGDKEKSLEEIKSHIQFRIQHQALGSRCAGSVFKNINLSDYPDLSKNYENIPSRDGRLAAGWFIEQCGLKGREIGGARVSNKHANFIINTGSATAQDVLSLINLIKKTVFEKFQVKLEEEIKLLGFN